MEINKSFHNVSVKSLLSEGSFEQTVQNDTTLPDYYPDIVRIIRCSLRPNIFTVNCVSDKITVEGNALITLLYLSDDEKMYCYEQRIPFSKTVDVKSDDDAVTVVDSKTEYVNCRVLSQRHFDVHAAITVSYKAYVKNSFKIIADIDEPTVQIRRKSLDISNLHDHRVKYFNINETFDISSTQPTVSQIVSSSVTASVNETKMISDKILIKGNLSVSLLYLSDKDNSLEKVENTIPFSQIAEINSDDSSREFVKLSVSGYDIFAKTDSSGSLRLFDLSATVKAEISVFDNVSITAADDAYSTKYELENDEGLINPIFLKDSVKDTYFLRSTLDVPDVSLESVSDLKISDISLNAKIENGTLSLTGTAEAVILVKTRENGFYSFERQLDFKYEKSISSNAENAQTEFSAALSGASYNILSDNTVEIRAEFDINALIFSSEPIRLLKDTKYNENKTGKTGKSGITLYFADKGESVWSIAKRYNTTVDSLMNSNGINSDFIENNCKLLIVSK